MKSKKPKPADAGGGLAGNAGTLTSAFNDTTDSGQAQALAEYHLARWQAGGTAADLGKARVIFSDLPDDRADVADWLAVHLDVAEAVGKIDPDGLSPDAPPLDLLTAHTILTTVWPAPVWAIPDLLPAGLTILAGKPKVGKSWLALQIAQSVATGGFALGEHVDAGPILYLALEDSPARLQARMRKQNWSLNLHADFMVLGQFAKQIDDLRNGGGERLALQIERVGYRLVVIDTLSRSCYGDQSDVEQMTAALTPIQEMAHEGNCAVLVIDHHRKAFGADPDAIGDILGSTAKSAMADCIWGLYKERGKAGAKLAITGRDVEERTLALTWDFLTGCWQVEGDADELALTERRQGILDALAGMGRASLKDIASVVEQPKSHTHSRLQDLFNANLVVRIEQGNRVYYELP
ncbi:MAG: AAA family ATPase [Chloroflexota bacterium]|nr:AAA family ATPase [Chloroflexota bacterium]